MKGPPLGPRGEDITWPDQVALWGRRTSSTRNPRPQTSPHEHQLKTMNSDSGFG